MACIKPGSGSSVSHRAYRCRVPPHLAWHRRSIAGDSDSGGIDGNIAAVGKRKGVENEEMVIDNQSVALGVTRARLLPAWHQSEA